MADTPETPAAKRRRLRLITLAELIGVLAVAISAASYWDSHRDRVQTSAAPVARAVPLLLTATADVSRAVLALRPARGEAVVQTQTLIFPPGVRAEPVETTGNARLEAVWIDDGIRRNVPTSADARPPRLPVGIVTVFEDGGATRTDAALYEIGYTLHGRLLRGRAVELEGITLVRRLPAAALPAAVAARWTKTLPTKD